MKCRFRCGCGNVFDGNEYTNVCPRCGRPLPVQNCGAIQLYRMGNIAGMAVGMGIYIDDVPFGHIANKESIRLIVPYGTHKIHVTHTTTRACNDPLVTVTPQMPVAFMKAHFAGMGFTIQVDFARPEEMPRI
ncbi:MAG: hypothetical protein K6E28_08525 [Eubacterium sp.]|nr:hypothetical protein [Eubacterium sp.]